MPKPLNRPVEGEGYVDEESTDKESLGDVRFQVVCSIKCRLNIELQIVADVLKRSKLQ